MRWFDAAQETVWHAIMRADPDGLRRTYDLRDRLDSLSYHARVWWGGVAVTALALLITWCVQSPETLATTNLKLEPSADSATSAAFLSDAMHALDKPSARLAVIGDDHYLLQRAKDGNGVAVVTTHHDPKTAIALNQALVAALLATPPPLNVAADVGPGARAAQKATRARAVSDLDAADRRAATLSQSLTDLARDMVAALRATDNRSVSTEVADQGAALLAELQMKRVQLASKYQDGYPPLVALDGEIAKLRGVVSGEQKRSSVVRSAADPVFAALAAERRRVGQELDVLNAKRANLHSQIDATDRRVAAVAPLAATPHFTAGSVVTSYGPDPRLISMPLMLGVGLIWTLILQWLLLRERQQLVTPAEVELALGLPVLRCLDANGVSHWQMERPALRIRGPGQKQDVLL